MPPHVYVTHVRSILEYCGVVWDNCTAAQTDQLEKLQRECLRIISGLPLYFDIDHLYRESGLERLATRCRLHRLILLFKAAILGDCPQYFIDLLPLLRNDPSARRGHSINVFNPYPFTRNTKFLSSFFPCTTRDWNSLQLECRTASSIGQFKRLIFR